jgi:hypothetical protein
MVASIGAGVVITGAVVVTKLSRSAFQGGALLGSLEALGGRLDFFQDGRSFLISLVGALVAASRASCSARARASASAAASAPEEPIWVMA